MNYSDGKTCPYCQGKTEFVDSSYIYHGRSYGMIWICKPCGAYVGVHKGTDKALGRLANKELREAKKLAHKHFDKVWKDNWFKSRWSTYEWLSREMNIPTSETHIGMFDVEKCSQVVAVCESFFESKNSERLGSN